MTAQHHFELLTDDDKVIEWTGADGPDAARRCADCKRVTIVAWRWPRFLVAAASPDQIIG